MKGREGEGRGRRGRESRVGGSGTTDSDKRSPAEQQVPALSGGNGSLIRQGHPTNKQKRSKRFHPTSDRNIVEN